MATPEFANDYYHFTSKDLRDSLRARTHTEPELPSRTKAQRRKQRTRYLARLRELDNQFKIPFMDLPPELRNLVYEALLFRTNGNQRLWPQILATNKFVWKEASPVLYTLNEFGLRLPVPYLSRSVRIPYSQEYQSNLNLAGRCDCMCTPGRGIFPLNEMGKAQVSNYLETTSGLPRMLRNVRRLSLDLFLEGWPCCNDGIAQANAVLFALVYLLSTADPEEVPKRVISVIIHHGNSEGSYNLWTFGNPMLTSQKAKRVMWPLALLSECKGTTVTFQGMSEDSIRYLRSSTWTFPEILKIFRKQELLLNAVPALTARLNAADMDAQVYSLRGRCEGMRAVRIGGMPRAVIDADNMHWLRQELYDYEKWLSMVEALLREGVRKPERS